MNRNIKEIKDKGKKGYLLAEGVSVFNETYLEKAEPSSAHHPQENLSKTDLTDLTSIVPALSSAVFGIFGYILIVSYFCPKPKICISQNSQSFPVLRNIVSKIGKKLRCALVNAMLASCIIPAFLILIFYMAQGSNVIDKYAGYKDFIHWLPIVPLVLMVVFGLFYIYIKKCGKCGGAEQTEDKEEEEEKNRKEQEIFKLDKVKLEKETKDQLEKETKTKDQLELAKQSTKKAEEAEKLKADNRKKEQDAENEKKQKEAEKLIAENRNFKNENESSKTTTCDKTCATCDKTVFNHTSNTSALGNVYHNGCFKCKQCQHVITVGEKFKTPPGGQNYPLHKTCYADLYGDKCTVCRLPIVDNQLKAMGNSYHEECFKCKQCQHVIQWDEIFSETTDGPLHTTCYDDLYGKKCTVCESTIQEEEFLKHPIFEEYSCKSHSEQRSCFGCDRLEPIGSNRGFTDLGDGNKCLCGACHRTVIVDSDGAKPLWKHIIRFFDDELKLPIHYDMTNIPIHIVSNDTLNSQSQEVRCSSLSNYVSTKAAETLSAAAFSEAEKGFNNRGLCVTEGFNGSKTEQGVKVKAILCLTGSPADRAASILAHEATHAWILTHPDYDFRNDIPPQVEEGVCQLVAKLFLTKSRVNDHENDDDAKLRQYLEWCIENDETEVYGKGYRKAAKAYEQIGSIGALLSHVVKYREFPNDIINI